MLCSSTGREPTDTVLMQTEKLGVNNRYKGQNISQLLQSIIMLKKNTFVKGQHAKDNH